MAASGMVNEAWMLDDRYVLRITIVEEAYDEADREAWVVPLARAAGVRSPELLVADTSRALVDAPYTIYERATGELLGHLANNPAEFMPTYRELGREMALMHTIEIPEQLRPRLHKTFTYVDDAKVEKTLECGKIDEVEAREIHKWIARLNELIEDRSRRAFLHQDIHPWNMFVDPKTKELTAIIDWGDAAWGDPAGEFSSMPLIAMPEMFAGYEEAGGVIDDSMKARALIFGLGLEMWELRELDTARFNRNWWRHPVGGFDEALAIFNKLLG
jgi:aminoglycoside phosphotransferase (APT) family kinase protein